MLLKTLPIFGRVVLMYVINMFFMTVSIIYLEDYKINGEVIVIAMTDNCARDCHGICKN